MLPSNDGPANRYNVDLMLNEANNNAASNFANVFGSKLQSKSPSICSTSSTEHITTIPSEKKQSVRLVSAPSFPPPSPPVHPGTSSPAGQIDATSKLLHPTMLPPPLPPPSSSKSTSPLSQPLPIAQIVSAEFTINRKIVKLTIEQESFFEQLLDQMGSGDRVKLACALVLCNNDIKLAKNMLNSVKN